MLTKLNEGSSASTSNNIATKDIYAKKSFDAYKNSVQKVLLVLVYLRKKLLYGR